MHIILHLIPRHYKSRPMGTKYRTGRILQIPLRIIADRCEHFLGIAAWLVPTQTAGKPSPPLSIGNHFPLIILHQSNRRFPAEHCHLADLLRRSECSVHPLKIRERTSDHLRRNFQSVFIIWLQQYAFCLFQSLPHSPVSCLPEITALRVLLVCPTGNKCDLYIRDRRSAQHPQMFFFFQMCQDQTLPVFIQHIFTAIGQKMHSASGFSRLQQQMDFRVMPERFKMSDSLHGISDRFFIYNISGSELHTHTKPFRDHTFQDLCLDFSHQLRVDLSQAFIPYNMEQRFFLFQLLQILQHFMHITILRNPDLISQYRFQHRKKRF